MIPRVQRILETALYCADLAQTAAFYQQLLNVTPMLSGERLVALDAGQGTVLLLFQHGNSGALETPGGQVIYGNAYGRSAGDELTVSVRTVHLQISPQRPAGDRNVWPARVEKTVFQGDFTQVHILWGDQRLIARCAALDPLPAGQEVFISVDPKRVVLLGT